MTTSNKAVYTGVAGRSEIFSYADIPADVFGGDLDDFIFANGQNEFIVGGIDEDYIVAGAGDDTVYGDDQTGGIDGITIGSLTTEADVLLGGNGNDVMYGQSGFDYINGEADNDLIYGGLGDDFLQGGNGIDTIYGGAGSDVIWGGGTTNIPAGYAKTIEYSFNGVTNNPAVGPTNSSFGTIGSGDTSADYLDGGAGNDTIYGQDGNDTLLGGDGNDLLEGGTGSDLIFGGRGDDVLRGSFGAETLEGDDGNDQLSGGEDNDVINGGGGFDTVFFTDATGGVSVDLEAETSKLFFGNAGNDTLDSIEAIAGTAFGDQVIGSYVANIIDAGAGNDVLYGAYGADILIGGAGADRFVYAEQAESSLAIADTILDFQSGLDKIDLSAARDGRSFSLGLNPGGNGVQFLDVDFNQNGSVDMRIALAPGSNVVVSDLLL